MFRSASQIKVDGKGRIALPTRFRDEIVERSGGAMVVTVNNVSEHCLWLYPLDEWERVEKKINELPSFNRQLSALKRYFIGYATDVDMDKTGRILLPASLREFARLDKEAYIVGQGNKFEIWDAHKWDQGCETWMNRPDADILSPEMEVLQL